MSKGLTIENAKAASRELVSAVNAVLMAKAYALCERERMDKLDTELLQKFPIYSAGKHGRPVERITNGKDMFLADLDSADVVFHYAERQHRINEMGYKLPDGHCPACVAEELQRAAERLLIDSAVEYFPDVTFDKIMQAPNCIENLRKYIKLLCGLVVNAPGYKNPLTQKVVKA